MERPRVFTVREHAFVLLNTNHMPVLWQDLIGSSKRYSNGHIPSPKSGAGTSVQIPLPQGWQEANCSGDHLWRLRPILAGRQS